MFNRPRLRTQKNETLCELAPHCERNGDPYIQIEQSQRPNSVESAAALKDLPTDREVSERALVTVSKWVSK